MQNEWQNVCNTGTSLLAAQSSRSILARIRWFSAPFVLFRHSCLGRICRSAYGICRSAYGDYIVNPTIVLSQVKWGAVKRHSGKVFFCLQPTWAYSCINLFVQYCIYIAICRPLRPLCGEATGRESNPGRADLVAGTLTTGPPLLPNYSRPPLLPLQQTTTPPNQTTTPPNQTTTPS